MNAVSPMTLTDLFEKAEITSSEVKCVAGKEYIVRREGSTLMGAAEELAFIVNGHVAHVNPNYGLVVAQVNGERAEFYINMK